MSVEPVEEDFLKITYVNSNLGMNFWDHSRHIGHTMVYPFVNMDDLSTNFPLVEQYITNNPNFEWIRDSVYGRVVGLKIVNPLHKKSLKRGSYIRFDFYDCVLGLLDHAHLADFTTTTRYTYNVVNLIAGDFGGRIDPEYERGSIRKPLIFRLGKNDPKDPIYAMSVTRADTYENSTSQFVTNMNTYGYSEEFQEAAGALGYTVNVTEEYIEIRFNNIGYIGSMNLDRGGNIAQRCWYILRQSYNNSDNPVVKITGEFG